MNKRYQIETGSPLDYNELVAYIEIDNRYIGLLHQEEGLNNLRLKFFDIKEREVELDLLLEAIEAAKKSLLNK